MATDTKTFWEDIEIGRVLETGSLTLNAPEIRNFAQKYDPQPYHLDRDAAEASLFGGLCASGWHMTALMMKLISDQLDAEKIPLLGTGEVSWLEWYRPAFEEDSLSARMTVTEKSLPAGETDHGLVGCDIDVHNQDQKKVMALATFLMIEHTGDADG